MSVADGTGSEARVAQCRVPALELEAREFLQRLCAEVRLDLVLEQLPIALRCTRRDIAGCLPLIDAASHDVGHRRPRRLDVAPLPHRRDELGELHLRLALAAAERVVLDRGRRRISAPTNACRAGECGPS